jgi:hypothetical protein
MVGERGEARLGGERRGGGGAACARARERDPGHVEALREGCVYC